MNSTRLLIVFSGCLAAGNHANTNGGGVYSYDTVENCTLVGNWSAVGGGIRNNGGSVRNTILYANGATNDPDYSITAGGTLWYSCTPLGGAGAGN